MRRAIRRACAGVAPVMLALLVGAPPSFAWGENAERLIANKAVDTLPDEMLGYFGANRQFLVQHVTDPDEGNAKAPTDPRNNFIQLDHYGQFPFSSLPRSYTAAVAKYGRRAIETYGLLPWQIGLYSQKLTDALREHNWSEAKLAAALLAHYVAAAHDPFNTTINNDGRLSDQPGVNERFGDALVDRYQLFFFVKPNEAAFIRDPTDEAFEMALSAHAWLENVLLADRIAHEGLSRYGDEYYDRFYAQAGAVLIRQVSDASTDVGSYWMTAWLNAGRPQLPSY
ncbi:MAG TPA: hypothetical protein VMD78_14090 [Candidatus Baltobacteraceae bacterium]|nr:hypothetical protein [Candidatus Baltobacteraceae bacterium]